MRRCQLTLCGMLVLVLLCGFLFGCIQPQRSSGQAWAIAWLVIAYIVFAITRKWGPTVSGRTGRLLIGGLCVVLLVVTCFTVWAHYSAMHYVDLRDVGFPYPDRLVLELNEWLDTRYPPEGDNIKIHGEFPLVIFLLGTAVILLLTLNGILLGMITRKPAEGQASDREPLRNSKGE